MFELLKICKKYELYKQRFINERNIIFIKVNFNLMVNFDDFEG